MLSTVRKAAGPCPVAASVTMTAPEDAATLEVRRYRVGPMLVPVDATPLAAWLPNKAQPTGFAVDGARLWVITENPVQLHRFEQKGLVWTPTPNRGF